MQARYASSSDANTRRDMHYTRRETQDTGNCTIRVGQWGRCAWEAVGGDGKHKIRTVNFKTRREMQHTRRETRDTRRETEDTGGEAGGVPGRGQGGRQWR
eukprot:2779943-Rhodomonas_salina.1